MCIHIKLSYFTLQQKLAQHSKSIRLKLKIQNNNNKKNPSFLNPCFFSTKTPRTEYGELETKLLERMRFSNKDDSISKWY